MEGATTKSYLVTNIKQTLNDLRVVKILCEYITWLVSYALDHVA